MAKIAKTEEKTMPVYVEAVGRRKTSTARVRIWKGKGEITVNKKGYAEYLPEIGLRHVVLAPLKATKIFGETRIEAKVKGGGINSQAGALQHGLSRALVKFNPDFRKILKPLGFLKRDSRMKERRKFGLKKARKAPQWSKR
jgi:small subunit ribosomal protein S9